MHRNLNWDVGYKARSSLVHMLIPPALRYSVAAVYLARSCKFQPLRERKKKKKTAKFKHILRLPATTVFPLSRMWLCLFVAVTLPAPKRNYRLSFLSHLLYLYVDVRSRAGTFIGHGPILLRSNLGLARWGITDVAT
jgi:hypothetical protein